MLAATAGYVVITCVFYWKGVRHIADAFISDGADGAAFLWNWWHLPHRVFNGENPFSAPDMFFPVGARLGFHTTAPLEAFAAWALGLVLSTVLAVNLVNLAGVVLTGLGAFMLARHECHDDRVAFVAGAAFLLLPQHTGRIDAHWNLNHLWVLPFALWALLRVYDQPTPKRGAVLGLFVGAAFLTDLTLFVFWLGAALLIALWRRHETAEKWRALGIGAVVASVASAPLLIPMVRDLQHEELDPLPQFGGAEEHSVDLVGFVTPSSEHPLWGGLFDTLDDSVFGLEEYPYMGLVLLGLAVVGVVRRLRLGAVGPWPLIAAVFAVLSLGPFLHVNGWTGDAFERFGFEFAVPLPFYVFHRLPLLAGLRIPGRFSMVTALAVGVMAAVTLARLLRNRPPTWQWRWGVPALVLAITMVELLPTPRIRLQSEEVPAAYKAIERSPDEGAVLEVPLFWRDGFGQVGDPHNHDLLLYYATEHGRPVVNGMIARLPTKRRVALYAIPVYRQMLTMQGQPRFNDPPTFTASDLCDLGIGFVAYHRSRPEPIVLAYLELLSLEQLADDGDTIVWRVPCGFTAEPVDDVGADGTDVSG